MLIRLFVFCIGAYLVTSGPANATPLNNAAGNPIFLKKISALKIKDLQKLTNRKFTLKEKIVFGILKHKLKKKIHPEENTNKGEMALIFGAGSLAVLLLSFLLYPFFFGALIAAILAILVGSSALKKDPTDKKAKTGKLLGWITLGLIVLIIALLVATINSLQING